MKILSFESSCDETAVAVVENGRDVLSSMIASQIDTHKLYGGVVPEIASRLHTESIAKLTHLALQKAQLTLEDIDAIAVTSNPGLIGALLVGVNFAKGLSFGLNKPLIAVNHILSHIAAAYIDNPTLKPPFLALVVSGGHSHLIEVTSHTEYNVIGRTIDDAVGEVFDKVARTLGLSYPGGVQIEKQALMGDENAIPLPTPKVKGAYDFSFSGLKTAVINYIHNQQQKNITVSTPDVAASFQTKVCDILISKLRAAVLDKNYDQIVIAGGVCANKKLRETVSKLSEELSIPVFMPSISLCGDNAAMVGALAYYHAIDNNYADMSLNANSVKL